jgi:hypothetical protein
MTGTRAQDPADPVFTIGRTSCSRSPEYAPDHDVLAGEVDRMASYAAVAKSARPLVRAAAARFRALEPLSRSR